MKLIALSLLALFLTSCMSTGHMSNSSSIRHEEERAPLDAIVRSVAYALPGGIRSSSENRRIFRSRYVDLNGERWDVLNRSRTRAYAEIAVLGDRRPYSIEFDVIVEERESTDPLDQEFQAVGRSRPLTEKIYQRFLNNLEDRRKRRNLIDEFRAF